MELEIFKTGTHTDSAGNTRHWSADTLHDIANSYNKETSPAPVVVGHPKTDSPAYGWVESLKVKGDTLVATLSQMQDGFVKLLKEGVYKTRSAAFYSPDSANSPVKGKWYLRHLGFLGGAAPAIKGLKPLNFSDDEDITVINFEEENNKATQGNVFSQALNTIKDAFAQGVAHGHKDGKQEKSTQGATMTDIDKDKTTADFAEQEKKFKQREENLARKEADMAFQEKQGVANAFVETLVKEGKVLPAEKTKVVALFASLCDDKEKDGVTFADKAGSDVPTTQSQQEIFKGLLKSLPKRVEYDEKAQEDGHEAKDGSVDPTTLAQQGMAYQQEMASKGVVVSISDAVNHVQEQTRKES